MTRPQGQDAAVNPLTSSRAVRLALTKAANDTVGLMLSVSSIGEEVTALDDMLGMVDDGLMLVALERENMLAGLIAVDVEFRAAILEMETIGALLGRKAEQRAPTGTDKMLCEPLFETLLSAFPLALMGTPLEGWLDNVATSAKIANARAAGLVLKDCNYRIVTMNVDLGIADRTGSLMIALPLIAVPEPEVAAPPASVNWDSAFQEAVSEAPAQLDALLHRFPISLATAQGLRVGSVLNLTGCTVNSVCLLAKDGKMVAQAKLGQLAGYRAVRIQDAPAPELRELASPTPDMALSLPEPDTLDMEQTEKMAITTDLGLADDTPQVSGPIDGPSDEMPAMAAMPSDLDLA